MTAFHLGDGLRARFARSKKHLPKHLIISEHVVAGVLVQRADTHVYDISKKNKTKKTRKTKQVPTGRAIFTINSISKNNFLSIMKNFAILRLIGEPAL